jgi:chromosome segregation ATPase
MQQQEAKAAMTRDLPSIIDPAMQRKQKTIWRKLLFTLVFFGSFIWIGAQLSTNEKLQNDLQILLKTRDMREIGSIAVEEMRAMKGRLSYAPEAFSSKDGSPFHRFKLVALDELNMIKNRFEKATTEFTSRDRAVTETEDRLEKDRMLPDDSTALAAKDKEQAAQRKVAEMLAEKEQAAQRKVAEMLAEKEALEQEIAAMRAVQESSEEQSDSLGLEKEALNKQLQDQVAAVTSERDTLQQQIIFIQERIGSLSEAQSGLQKSIHNILEKSVKMLDT